MKAVLILKDMSR